MKLVLLNYSPSSYSIALDNMPYLPKISDSLFYLYRKAYVAGTLKAFL